MSNQASLGDISSSRDSKEGTDEHNEEWYKEKLGNLAIYQNGNSFSKTQWTDQGYPIIRIQNLTGEQEEFNYFDGDLDEKYKVENGDILLAWSGTIDLFQWEGEDAALNQHIYRVDTEKDVNDIFFQFKLEEVIPRLIALSHGSTMKHVRKADLVNLDVEIPSELAEQRRIASVLYNMDQAIQKTEEIIEQTERVKKGLMQDLFTEGYFEHEEFEDSRLGPIDISKPKEWDSKSLSDVFEIVDGDRGKNYPGSSELHEEGYCLFLNAGNVTSEGLRFEETEFVTEQKDEDMRKGKLERGDLIMTTRGTVGNIGFYSSEVDYDNMRINSGMVILRPDKDCSKSFFYHLFNSRMFQKQIENVSYGTAQPQISVSIAKKLGVVVPGKEEQEKIAEVLDNLDEKIENEVSQKEQLQRLKKGLMQDLLTGDAHTSEIVEVLDEVREVES